VDTPGLSLAAFLSARCVRIRFKGLETVWIVETEPGGNDMGLWFSGMKVPLELLRMLAKEDRMNIPVEDRAKRGRKVRSK